MERNEYRIMIFTNVLRYLSKNLYKHAIFFSVKFKKINSDRASTRMYYRRRICKKRGGGGQKFEIHRNARSRVIILARTHVCARYGTHARTRSTRPSACVYVFEAVAHSPDPRDSPRCRLRGCIARYTRRRATSPTSAVGYRGFDDGPGVSRYRSKVSR